MILPYHIDKIVKMVFFKGCKESRFLKNHFIKEVEAARAQKGKCIFVFNSPLHGNLGDHAILMAQRQIFSRYLDRYNIIDISTELCLDNSTLIRDNIEKDDIIVISDGGFIGTLYNIEQRSVLKALEFGVNNPVIIMPQTIFFSKDKNGAKELAKFKTKINKCSNIQIFVRDKQSYNFMVEQVVENTEICHLNCDLVTFLEIELPKLKRENVLFCLRTDKEKLETKAVDEIKQRLIEAGYKIDYRNTIIDQKIYTLEERNELVTDIITHFSKYKLVITDRLHGMLFSAVSSTACIAFDNLSRKSTGIYENSLHVVPYIICTDNNTSFDKTVLDDLLNLDDIEYDKELFADSYNKLIEILDGAIK